MRLYGVMQGAPKPGPGAATWFVEADRGTAISQGRRARPDGAASLRAVIATSAFLALLGACLLIGGHAAIAPLLRSVVAARDSRSVGDVVYTMPDGKFCRHMSFDNTTSEMIEGTIAPCEDDLSRIRQTAVSRGFSWRSR